MKSCRAVRGVPARCSSDGTRRPPPQAAHRPPGPRHPPGPLLRPALRVPPADGAASARGTAHLCNYSSCTGFGTETAVLFQYGLLQLLIKKLFLVLLISGKSALDWLLYLDFSRALGSSLLMVFRCRMKAAFAGDMLNHSRLPLLMLRGERGATFLELPSSPRPPCHGHGAGLRNRHWGDARLRTASAVLLLIRGTHQKNMENALTYRFCSFFLPEIFCWEIFSDRSWLKNGGKSGCRGVGDVSLC